jgi:hypothetical protein
MPEPGGPDPVPQSAPPKLWSVEEANASLDRLRELLPQLKAWAVRLGKIHAELQRLSQFWGKELGAQDIPDRDLKLRLEEEWKRLTGRLESEVKRLEAEGITVKDLENGLVDFYSRRRGEVVFLCWRRGEPDVGFWHPLSGGFRSRKPLEGRARTSPAARLSRDA